MLALILVSSAGALRTGPTSLAGPAGGGAPVDGHPWSPSPTTELRVAPAYAPATGVTEVGSVPANESLSVDVALASRDPAGLAAYVNATQVPGTPLYRNFLSPAAADARFGAGAQALAEARAYFAGFGLGVTANPDGLLLSVEGPGPSVAEAFGTALDVYRTADGAEFLAHPTAATLPEVAPWAGVFGLGDVGDFVPASGLAPAAPVAGPSGGAAGSCGRSYGYFSPCMIARAYDYADLAANGTNGSGETIAIFDAYSSSVPQNALATDFSAFSSAEGLPTTGLSFRYPVPTSANLNASGTNPAWGVEETIDVEWAHAAAPGAAIQMVFSPNAGAGLYFAIDWVVAHGAANVLSMSWGEPEVGIFDGGTPPCPPIACNASSDGSFDILSPILQLAAVEGISAFAASGDCGAADGTTGVATNYPASSAFVTGVGATQLTTSANGTYASEVAWSGNESTCDNGGGSGGGFSILPRPYWQVGPGTRADRGRGVPDVSIVGSASSRLVFYDGGFGGEAGTSIATPIWAGIAAIGDQLHGAALGLLNPALYAVLDSADYATDFHDITSGSNGYATTTGWDPVTGIGTPIVGALLPGLNAGVTAFSGLGTLVYASPRFGAAPLTVQFAVTASGGTGSYALEGIDFGDGNASTVLAGRTSHTFTRPGVYSAQAYVVDSSAAMATSPPVVIVVGGGGPLTVGLGANTASPLVGGTVTFTATASGGTAPYLYNFSFGDGAFADNQSAASLSYAYPAAGGFCAEVVARDAGTPPDGAASARVAIAVGGAAMPNCGNPSAPLTVVPNGTPAVRDAPADFPSLFRISGGTTAPSGLAAQVTLRSSDPYPGACGCAIFPTAGNYTVEEWDNDTSGDEASATVNVTVAPALRATFSASTMTGTAPLTVDFTATARGGDDADAANTLWRFGNGQHTTGASVATTYEHVGEYVAIADLSDAGDGNASEAFLLDVVPSGGSPVGLVGTVTPAVNVSSAATVAWNATAVGPAGALGGSTIVWNLGNGARAYGAHANETYFAGSDLLADDTLAASVALSTSHLTDLAYVPITLPGFFATEAAGFVPAADALQLATSVYPAVGVAPLSITGTATASGPEVSTVSWRYGDGDSASGASVSHVYYATGAFTVVARLYDGFDDVADRLAAVQVNPTLTLAGCGGTRETGTALFSATLRPGPVGGDGPPYTYAWTLPDGGTATTENVTVALTTPGTYQASVVVTDAANETATCRWTLVVLSTPAVGPLWVLVVGGAAGLGLAGFFVWATRPRSKGR